MKKLMTSAGTSHPWLWIQVRVADHLYNPYPLEKGVPREMCTVTSISLLIKINGITTTVHFSLIQILLDDDFSTHLLSNIYKLLLRDQELRVNFAHNFRQFF